MRKDKRNEEDHHRAGSLIKADWWVDHLEKETEPNLAEDLEVLLKNSQEDLRILASLKKARQLVKASDDVPMPESGLYYNDLHNKIMAAIDFEEIPQSRRESQSLSNHVKHRRASYAWQGAFGGLGLAMMIALMSWVGVRNAGVMPSARTAPMASIQSVGENLERSIAAVGASFSDDVNGFESEQEIVEEAAIARLSSLSKAEVDELFRKMRE